MSVVTIRYYGKILTQHGVRKEQPWLDIWMVASGRLKWQTDRRKELTSFGDVGSTTSSLSSCPKENTHDRWLSSDVSMGRTRQKTRMLPFNSWMVLWSSRRIVSSERNLNSRPATCSRRPCIVSSSFAIVSLFCWLSLRVFSRLTFWKDINGDILNEQSYLQGRSVPCKWSETPSTLRQRNLKTQLYFYC